VGAKSECRGSHLVIAPRDSLRGHWGSRDGARYAVDLVVELHADFSKSRKFKSDGRAWEELALLLGCHRLTLVAIHGQLGG
jgi:hypothetical protein